MKLVQITYHFEFSDELEAILDEMDIVNFARHPMIESKDRDGKHYGSKVYPGSGSVIQALVPDDSVNPLLEALQDFKEAEESHRHLTAVVLAVEKQLH